MEGKSEKQKKQIERVRMTKKVEQRDIFKHISIYNLGVSDLVIANIVAQCGLFYSKLNSSAIVPQLHDLQTLPLKPRLLSLICLRSKGHSWSDLYPFCEETKVLCVGDAILLAVCARSDLLAPAIGPVGCACSSKVFLEICGQDQLWH